MIPFTQKIFVQEYLTFSFKKIQIRSEVMMGGAAALWELSNLTWKDC